MGKSNEKEEFWRLVIEEQGASGLSVRAFCEREGVSEPSFYAWRKRLRDRDEAGQPRFGCQQIVETGVAPVIADVVANREQIARLVVQEVEIHLSGFRTLISDLFETVNACRRQLRRLR